MLRSAGNTPPPSIAIPSCARCAFLDGMGPLQRDNLAGWSRLVAGTILGAGLAACRAGAPPIDAVALMAEAERALEAGDAEASDRLLATILEHDPDHVPALVSRGKLHAREGRLAAAAAVYARLAELRPQNGLYALRAGSYLESSGRFRDALRYLERAARQRPDDPDARYRLGTHFITAGEIRTAVEHLRRAHERAPRRTDIAVKLAQALEQNGETPAALAVLDDIIAIRPGDSLVRFVRGLVRSRGGQFDRAVEDLEMVVRNDPELHPARYALARALLASGRRDEGTVEMERFIAEDQQRRRDLSARRVARLAGASPDDSPLLFRSRMEELVLSDPSNAEANRQLARAYAREGDDQMAEMTYARAARLDPEDPTSRRERGRLLLRMDRPADAIAPLVDAAGLAPEDETIRRLLVEARRLASAGDGGEPR